MESKLPKNKYRIEMRWTGRKDQTQPFAGVKKVDLKKIDEEMKISLLESLFKWSYNPSSQAPTKQESPPLVSLEQISEDRSFTKHLRVIASKIIVESR